MSMLRARAQDYMLRCCCRAATPRGMRWRVADAALFFAPCHAMATIFYYDATTRRHYALLREDDMLRRYA